MKAYTSHASADISPLATIGAGCMIWHGAQVREYATIGSNCVVGKNVYIDRSVVLGNSIKVQNNANIYRGVTIEDNVFIGPGVLTTNDRYPRATRRDGTLKLDTDWTPEEILICKGASIGAGAILLPGITVGEYALVAAGSVVTANIVSHGLSMGIPAKHSGYVCYCGEKLTQIQRKKNNVQGKCSRCQEVITFTV